MIGNSCFMAQLSGMLWNSEKLQKYVSESRRPGLPALPGSNRDRPPSSECGGRSPNTDSRPGCADQRKVSEAEQIQRLVERLLRIVKAFEQILRAVAIVSFLQVDQRLFRVFREVPEACSTSPNPLTPSTLNTSTL